MKCAGRVPWCFGQVRARAQSVSPTHRGQGVAALLPGNCVSDTLQSVIGTVALILHDDATWRIRHQHLQCATYCSRKQNFGKTVTGFWSFPRSAAREAKSSRITGCRKRSAGLGAVRFNPEEHQETTERKLWIELCLKGLGKGVL